MQIVDPETNEELPDGTDGEFVTRGYYNEGLLQMPEATAAAIDEDGWLHTGDLAEGSKRLLSYYRKDQGYDNSRRRKHIPQGVRTSSIPIPR